MADLIDRQMAIGALQKEINKGIPPFDDVFGSIRAGVRLARNIIEDLPAAQLEPEHRMGVWSSNFYSGIFRYTCSVCKAVHRARYDFCPSCGAKMER